MGNDYQSPITDIMDEFGKHGVKSLSHNQSQIHSDYDSAESIADSDLEDGQLRKMLASPLYIREREGTSDSSRKPRASGKPDAETSVVSGTMRISVQSRHQKPLHHLSHQHQVEVDRGKGAWETRSPSGKFARQPCKDLKGFCTKSPCDCWHPPECQFFLIWIGL